MSRLTLQLLGPFAAAYGGEPLRGMRTKAAEALLIYLACQPAPHPRDSLMDLFWPSATRASAQALLRQTLYLLRKAVPLATAASGGEPVPFLLANRQTVQANPEATFTLDVADFERLLSGPDTQWPRAVQLYRGDFLCDFYLAGSAPFEAWALGHRAALRQQCLDALDTLVARNMKQGTYAAAEEFARQQLSVDNLHERAHRQLMEILVQLGRRSQALAHYDTFCRLLQQELGTCPPEESRRFIQQVRSGEFDSSPVAPAPPAAPPIRAHNLPPEKTRLVGRERDLAELAALAAGPGKRLISIVGLGGVGKTRLALAFARQQLRATSATGGPHPASGVFFVPLQPARSRDEMVAAVVAALGLSLDGFERRSPQELLLDFLREKQLLLVLDNFEHLTAEAAFLGDILAAAPGLKLLVTSRERLDLYEEQAFPLRGLSVPREETALAPEALSRYGATALFLKRARRIQPGYLLAPDEAPALAELCRLVAGLPLALELAATWIDVLSPAQMVAEIRQNLDFLAAGTRNVPERHRSIRAVFDSTWSRLSPREQDALAQLSVFRGEFDAQAASAVAGAGPRTLARLLRKSVLQGAPGSGRFRMHELLRQYSAARLAALPAAPGAENATSAALSRHSAYYCRRLGAWEQALKSERQPDAIAEIAADLENVRAAWEWAASNQQTELLAQAVAGLATFVECRGNYHLGQRLFRSASEALEAIAPPAPEAEMSWSRLYGKLLAWRAYCCDFHQEQCLRQELIDKSLALLEELQADGADTRPERAEAWRIRSVNYRNDWRHEKALQAAQMSLELSQGVGDEWAIAGALEALGRSAVYLRRFDDGREWLQQCVDRQRRLGNLAGEAVALRWLADIEGSQGDFARDEALTRASLDIHERLGNQRAAVHMLANLGVAALHHGRFEEAARLYQEGQARARHLGVAWLVAYLVGALAGAREAQGAYDEAAALAREALDLLRDRSAITPLTLALRLLATVALVQGRYGDATRYLQKRRTALQDSVIGQQIGHACAAYAAIGLEDDALAARHLHAALLGKDQSAASLLWALPAGALLLARQRETAPALAVYAAAARQPFIGNSRWFDDVAGAPLREAARTLPPRAVQAAGEQGCTWEIWRTAEFLRHELQGVPVWPAAGGAA